MSHENLWWGSRMSLGNLCWGALHVPWRPMEREVACSLETLGVGGVACSLDLQNNKKIQITHQDSSFFSIFFNLWQT